MSHGVMGSPHYKEGSTMSSRDPFTTKPVSSATDPLETPGSLTEPVSWQNDDYIDPTDARPGETGGNQVGSVQDKASDMASQAQDKASDMAGKVQEKAGNVGAQAQEQANAGMDKAAAGLGQAADVLRSQGSQREGAVGTAATRTADTLESASQYLHEKDTDQLVQDIEAFVRKRPVESVLIAAGVGFLLSRLVR
jgi:ElaB/YqjD/DUF883 family membrane-anchored ribosome-binding protein